MRAGTRYAFVAGTFIMVNNNLLVEFSKVLVVHGLKNLQVVLSASMS